METKIQASYDEQKGLWFIPSIGVYYDSKEQAENAANNPAIKIRCNNCMRIWNSEEDLPYIYGSTKTHPEPDEFKGCPDCQSDEYLMDLD